MMSEEEVTMELIRWLRGEGWKIIAFDYPGSGTGIRLHKNGTRHRNKDTIVPDIIAVKNNLALFFENKARFYKKDFEKQYYNIVDNKYSDGVKNLLESYKVKKIMWGIGIPEKSFKRGAKDNLYMVDFLYTVDEFGKVEQKK